MTSLIFKHPQPPKRHAVRVRGAGGDLDVSIRSVLLVDVEVVDVDADRLVVEAPVGSRLQLGERTLVPALIGALTVTVELAGLGARHRSRVQQLARSARGTGEPLTLVLDGARRLGGRRARTLVAASGHAMSPTS